MLGKIAGYYLNDTAAAPGMCVSVYVSGCNLHCKGCHNPEAQDFNYGEELTEELIQKILLALNANGIMRKLCILGGEPLHPMNVPTVQCLIKRCRQVFRNLEIYLWTGYEYNEIKNREDCSYILSNINCLIDGPYKEELRDTTLPMRGSSNQNIITLKSND